jgi:hypothetical protein
LRGSSLINVNANFSAFRIEGTGTATVSTNGAYDTVRFISPVYDTQFANAERVMPDDSFGAFFPAEAAFEKTDGQVLRRLTVAQPKIGSDGFEYLRAFTYGVSDAGTGNPLTEDFYRTTAGLESSIGTASAAAGASYKLVYRGLGRRNSLPTLVDERSDAVNSGSIRITSSGNQVEITGRFFGRLINDDEVLVGNITGTGGFTGDGSSFTGTFQVLDGGPAVDGGTFVGAFYGPNADEVVLTFELDADPNVRLVFGITVFGLRE